VDYPKRYSSIRPQDCRRCHGDPHYGQFRRQACLSCHSQTHFKPSTFEVAQHAKTRFPLTGAHQTTTCLRCHPVMAGRLRSGKTARWRRFRGRPSSCKKCHQNPHGKQFDARLKRGDCSACHDDEGWQLPEFDHSKTRFTLGRAHEQVACAACHEKRGKVTRYRPLETSCAGCHEDPHLGQFAADASGSVRCDRCHKVGAPKWAIAGFDHTKTRFPLDGAHIKVACAKCHKEYKLRDGQVVVRYRPLAFDCKACHGSFDKDR
jgi:hypothetical protein